MKDEPQVASARILGGVGAVAHDGSLIDVPSSTQRRLLGILALEAPRSVRPERLASLLGVSSGAVRTTVARLRSSVGSVTLRRTANGYSLTCDVDAGCFCNAVARASGSTAPSPVLQEALMLWGGAPLEEFADEAWAHGEVLRLTELHDGAIDDFAELLVEARRSVDAVALLQRQVDGRPLRDRSQGLLIRALAVGGRQSDALRSYQSYRLSLVDVGTRPSPGVIEIERRVAAGWDGVEGIASASAVTSKTV